MGHNSARYIHVITEALKLAFADRERFYGDATEQGGGPWPSSSPGLPARAGRAHPPGSRRSGAAAPGDPRRRGDVTQAASVPCRRSERGRPAADGTTHIAAVDREGNMMCLTPSGGVFRKSAFAAELAARSARAARCSCSRRGIPNALTPGRRPRTTLVSYLISEAGVPTMTIGCPGATIRSRPISSRPQRAALRHESAAGGGGAPLLHPDPRQLLLSARLQARPAQRGAGHSRKHAQRAPRPRPRVTEIGACGIGAVVSHRDPNTGVLSAGADPRRPTYALAW